MPTLLAHVLAFAGAALLLAMAPGPATATLLQTIRCGRRRGAATVAGIASGVSFWAVTASVSSGVLIGLGAKALLRSRRERENTELDAAVSPTPPVAGRAGWSACRAGLVTNLANRKAGVFAISFLPQFIPHGYPVLPTGLLLAAV